MTALGRLPGIGPKTAERLALYLVRAPAEEARGLARAIARLKEEVATCSRCFNLAESDPCSICADPARDPGLIAVVETPADLMALEAAQSFRGRYHVLAGALSPLDGVGPQHLRLGELLARVKAQPVREVIIATNPTVEGEATADLVARALAASGVLVTRLGYGVPVGGDLKYMDGLTLSRSLASRRKIEE
ncbi:MAG: recombination protein RecR [Desulfarculus sp.]|nr:recombination protein RecR [Desulfarculus sp.]